MELCFDEHNIRKILDKYTRQTPKDNIKMFEEMDKERKHGTWFYPLLNHERDKEKIGR